MAQSPPSQYVAIVCLIFKLVCWIITLTGKYYDVSTPALLIMAEQLTGQQVVKHLEITCAVFSIFQGENGKGKNERHVIEI